MWKNRYFLQIAFATIMLVSLTNASPTEAQTPEWRGKWLGQSHQADHTTNPDAVPESAWVVIEEGKCVDEWVSFRFDQTVGSGDKLKTTKTTLRPRKGIGFYEHTRYSARLDNDVSSGGIGKFTVRLCAYNISPGEYPHAQDLMVWHASGWPIHEHPDTPCTDSGCDYANVWWHIKVVPATSTPSTPTKTPTPRPTTATPFSGCAAISDIPQSECEALVTFYNSTGGTNWTDNTGWLATNAACDWKGIFCDDGHVTDISLHDKNLVGTLPSALADLPYLEELTVDSNQLSGSIPSEIGNLSLLEEFDIDDNNIEGGIPQSFRNLTNLKWLEIEENRLEGSVPEWLNELTQLRELDIDGNQFEGDFPAAVCNLNSLTSLGIKYNMLTADTSGKACLDSKVPGWENTQTVLPTDIEVIVYGNGGAEILWTPIRYTGDEGFYSISYAPGDRGVLLPGGTTSDKSSSSFFVDGDVLATEFEQHCFQIRTKTKPHSQNKNLLISTGSRLVCGTATSEVTSSGKFYFSLLSSTDLPGLENAHEEDVLYYSYVASGNNIAGQFSRVFDGRANGADSIDIDALIYTSENNFLFSTQSDEVLPNVGSVEDGDILRYRNGRYEMFIRNSDFPTVNGETALQGEDIKGMAYLNDNCLLLTTSTTARFGWNDDDPAIDDDDARDNDLICYNPNSRQYSLYMDGSDLGIDDIEGISVGSDGALYLLCHGEVCGSTSETDNIVRVELSSTGWNTLGTVEIVVDNAKHGIDGKDYDALHILENPTVPQPLPPTAAFATDKSNGQIPLTVSFEDKSTGDISSWLWDFGDGTTSTEQNPQHVYNTAGSYTVQLTATGPNGADTKIRENYITVTPPPPTANFTANVTTGEVPLTVGFSNQSTGYITGWIWDFGNGEFSTVQEPTYAFVTPGIYQVELTVYGDGGESKKTVTITVQEAPTPTFTPKPPTDTPTFTPIPPTFTPTFTPIPPTDTPTFTPIPPTNTPLPIATNTPTPVPTLDPSKPNLYVPIGIEGKYGEKVSVSVNLATNGHELVGITTMLQFDANCLSLDPTDANGDNLADAITLDPQMNYTPFANFDTTTGEFSLMLLNIFRTPIMVDGPIASLEFTVICESNPGESIIAPITFVDSPPTTFGGKDGADTLGLTQNGFVVVKSVVTPTPIPPTDTPTFTPEPTDTPLPTDTPTPTTVRLQLPSEVELNADKTISMPIQFTSNGEEINSTAFVVEYDNTCLSFDETDSNGNGYPDSITTSTNFDIAVSTDIGEIRIGMFKMGINLPDAEIMTINFSVICEPPTGETQIIPVTFSNAPSASFGSLTGESVPGVTQDGSVKITGTELVGLRGDCNSSDRLDAGDPAAIGLEIQDNDGTLAIDVKNDVPFDGYPVGCDADANDHVEVLDIKKTINFLSEIYQSVQPRIAGKLARDNDLFAMSQYPELVIKDVITSSDGTVTASVEFIGNGYDVASIIFALDFNQTKLTFDATDNDADGLPDAIQSSLPEQYYSDTIFDPALDNRELFFGLVDLDIQSGLADGEILTLTLHSDTPNIVTADDIRLSTWPSPMFGDIHGQEIGAELNSQSSLTLHQQTTPGTHTLHYTLNASDTLTLTTGQPYTLTNITPGTHTIALDHTSYPDKHWQLLTVQCYDRSRMAYEVDHDNQSVDITVEPGEHLTCELVSERAGYLGEKKIYVPLLLKK